MRNVLPGLRPTALAVAAGALALAAGAAGAQTQFTGFTTGCFGAACAPETTYSAATDVLSGLTYANSTFNVLSAGGTAGIGSTGMISPAANIDNLGSWLLSGSAFGYGGNSFTLRVAFTSPPGTTPGSALFTSTLTGNVISSDNGGLFIDFDNSARNFTFTGGAFSLVVADIALTPGALPVAETGFIQVSAIPEPETYALFLAGLGAVGFMARRRRS